jgi:hypothetical protein
MARATQQEGRALTSKSSGARIAIVLAALIVAGLPLEVTEKMFGRKFCLSPKQSVKRRKPLWVIRKVAFVI